MSGARIRPASDASFCLQGVNLSVKAGNTTVITGPEGCGKTTLLKGILGEIPREQGSVTKTTSGAAYCSQSPWLQNMTILDVVCGASEFDPAWYRQVIRDCALEYDLSQMLDGDKSVVGSRALTLSGGQKQRLALARAVYARRKLVILDDVFSAVDSKTEQTLVERLFGKDGRFQQSGFTVILVTHSVCHLSLADHIVVLGPDGGIMEQGSFQNDSQTSPGKKMIKAPIDVDFGELSRRTGDVAVFSYYLKAIEVWLKWFTENNRQQPGRFIRIYVLLAVAASVSQDVMIWQIMMKIVMKSGAALHKILIQTVMRAPMHFFAEVDSGTTLNRFSQDMTLVDARWLNVVLDLLVAVLAVIVTALSMSLRSTTSPGNLGVSLTAILAFDQTLQDLVSSCTSLETSLGAISRTRSFEMKTPAEEKPGEDFIPEPSWPSKRAINICSVYASCDQTTNALENISMTVNPGEKIGICGRTGSGKSTLLSVLLRLQDIKGCQILIDGIDITTIPRDVLRSRLIAIPQDPLILAGSSVRFNAGPAGRAPDEEIIAGAAQSPPLGAPSRIPRRATATGQILILDEATSNVDTETGSCKR
ncbi:hypothetical protein VTN00DRAFT_10393 [Thermoascus crustaceus]|uniref:uncharacterized protein n=1 Tax=Thermoascus crustaceus TaxID=5088 RepID=UPI003742B2DE